jgi:tetraacyldisaccharide 4'-kinase
MKKSLRYFLLLPFSLLYGSLTAVRNWLYDNGLLKSREKNTALISVGNITVGGTGKTPHVEFIISELQSLFRVAVLSRGYGRKTKGFLLLNDDSTSEKTGDEPYQIFLKYPHIPVAVCENRSTGVDKLLELFPNLDAIILDDAFQHRSISAGLSVLLTEYSRLHTRDSMLPGGNLRESAKGSKRAGIIIVTKCPEDIKPIEMRVLEHELIQDMHQDVFFSGLIYDEPLPLFIELAHEHWLFSKIKQRNASVLLVTGIASPVKITEYLSMFTSDIETLTFGDHHDFTKKELLLLEKKFTKIISPEKLILITEKDAARLINHKDLPETLKKYIFVLPVRVNILNDKENLLIKKITDYVTENSGNH